MSIGPLLLRVIWSFLNVLWPGDFEAEALASELLLSLRDGGVDREAV